MPREVAELPKGTRITDFISLGVLTKAFPISKVKDILAQTGRSSVRQRDLPAHVMVYYVIALALYMQSSYREVLRCLYEGLSWMSGDNQLENVAAKSAISQARTRLGVEPLRMLYHDLVMPVSTVDTRGSRYRGWLLVSLDGSTLDVADTADNRQTFTSPSGKDGEGSYPQLRFVSLAECGTHVLFGAAVGGFRTGETVLAKESVKYLDHGMFCIADRGFLGYGLWKEASATGADLLWRGKKNLVLPCIKRFSDGSYLGRIYPSTKDRRHDRNGIDVRVIEYMLTREDGAEDFYRLLTTVLSPKDAPAEELGYLYHERWEIETAFDEFKTHLRGARIVLRSKTPEGVLQEFYGLLLAHFAIRGLMHEAALGADLDPDRLSFVHTLRVVRRKISTFNFIPPCAEGELS